MSCCKMFVLFLTLIFVTSTSFSQNEYHIKIYFEGAVDNDVVYLHSTNNDSDTSFVKNKQVQFSLSKMVTEWQTFFITYKGEEKRFDALLFHNAKSDINLVVDKEFSSSTITGDTIATEQDEFFKGLAPLTKKHKLLKKQLSETADSVIQQRIKREIYSLVKRDSIYKTEWVKKNNKSPFSVAVIRLFIDKSNILKALDTVAVNCFSNILPEAKENNREAFILQREFAMYNDIHSAVPINSIAPEFMIKDTAGNSITLKKFKGKWLLIDFWASWCVPCRKNNPLLREFFQQYHNKGLEVLSISVDTKSELWKAAIIKDNMTWHQGSDLSGEDSGVGKTYQIVGVPHYFLISPEGRIITKSLGGDIQLIKAALKEFLK